MNDTVVIGGNQRLRNTVSGQANLRNVQSGAPNSSIRVVGSKFDETGTYPDLTAGNILSDNYEEDSTPYLFRQSGGGVRVGTKEEDEIVGGSIAWNQQLSYVGLTTKTNNGITFTVNSDMSVTLTGTATAQADFNFPRFDYIENHKYLILGIPSTATLAGHRAFLFSQNVEKASFIIGSRTDYFTPRIRVASGISGDNAVYRLNICDITQMFGSTVADYIYALETAHTGDGVSYFKSLFPKPYYAYNAGTLMHVSGLTSHDTTGKNLNPNSGVNITASTAQRIYVKPGQYVFSTNNGNNILSNEATYFALFDAETGGNNITSGTITSSYLTLNGTGTLYYSTININNIPFTITKAGWLGVGFNNQRPTNYTAFQIEFGSTATSYEPYHKNTYPLDSTLTLRGIPKVANNKVYYDGDTYASDGTVTRKYGIVDLGTLTWGMTTGGSSNNRYFSNSLNTVIKKPSANSVVANISCKEFVTASANNGFSGNVKNSITIDTSGAVSIYPTTNYTDASTFKTAMSGVYLVYELATPTTETATGYTNPQEVDADGTEEYVITTTADVAVPVGHVTKYPADSKQKLDGLPWDFSTLIAPTEKTFKATRAYTAKQFLIINNQLYRVTTSIANGANITVGTNVIATTIGEVLTSLL